MEYMESQMQRELERGIRDQEDLRRDAVEAAANQMYFITKGGAYYRPNAQGYTCSRDEAGLYTLAEAILHSHPNGPEGPRDGIGYHAAAMPAASEREQALSDYEESGDLGDLARSFPAPSDQEKLLDLLTKATGDIAAALILAGKADKIAKWTAPYVAAINEADARADEIDSATPAKAIEARRAETGTGSVHESAVPQAFAQPSAPGDPA